LRHARFARDAVGENRIANKDKTDPQQSNSTGVNVSSTAMKAKPQENLDPGDSEIKTRSGDKKE